MVRGRFLFSEAIMARTCLTAVLHCVPTQTNRPTVGFDEQQVGIDVKSIGDLLNVGKGDATLMTFHSADVGAMQPATLCEGLLRHVSLKTVVPYVVSEHF